MSAKISSMVLLLAIASRIKSFKLAPCKTSPMTSKTLSPRASFIASNLSNSFSKTLPSLVSKATKL